MRMVFMNLIGDFMDLKKHTYENKRRNRKQLAATLYW